jgi:hypothetical protein
MGWNFDSLGIVRIDGPDGWVVRANGKSILPLTGGWTARLSFYADDGEYRHLEVCDPNGEVTGYCKLRDSTFTDKTFAGISNIIERELSQGWGAFGVIGLLQ